MKNAPRVYYNLIAGRKELILRVGDIIRWAGPPFHRSVSVKYGLIVGKDGVFFKILWQSGEINGNVERQLEVISESR